MMAKISKTKEYAVRYLKEVIQMEDKQIAKELNLSEQTVVDVVGVESSNNANIKTVSSKADSFIKETSGKRTKNVTIMTQASSELTDDRESNINSKYKNAINKARE
jgi:regulator of extracellular matrix RemA (YlzA/DUF370 family)